MKVHVDAKWPTTGRTKQLYSSKKGCCFIALSQLSTLSYIDYRYLDRALNILYYSSINNLNDVTDGLHLTSYC